MLTHPAVMLTNVSIRYKHSDPAVMLTHPTVMLRTLSIRYKHSDPERSQGDIRVTKPQGHSGLFTLTES